MTTRSRENVSATLSFRFVHEPHSLHLLRSLHLINSWPFLFIDGILCHVGSLYSDYMDRFIWAFFQYVVKDVSLWMLVTPLAAMIWFLPHGGRFEIDDSHAGCYTSDKNGQFWSWSHHRLSRGMYLVVVPWFRYSQHVICIDCARLFFVHCF